MLLNTKCPRCGFGYHYLDPVIENEIGFYYCTNCGLRFQLNNQDGGAKIISTTKPGIEFVIPPGSTDMDIELLKTINELNTQTMENQRYDADADVGLQRALYGTTESQSGSGSENKRSRKRRKKKKKSRKEKSKNKKIKSRKSHQQRAGKLLKKTGGGKCKGKLLKKTEERRRKPKCKNKHKITDRRK